MVCCDCGFCSACTTSACTSPSCSSHRLHLLRSFVVGIVFYQVVIIQDCQKQGINLATFPLQDNVTKTSFRGFTGVNKNDLVTISKPGLNFASDPVQVVN